jgi:hypothetical protein
MKSNIDKRTSTAPTCWQREASCASLRVETSGSESQLFPYQHFITAKLNQNEQPETLRLSFSSHDVEIAGRNLRPLLIALQDFAVKWIRAVPARYQQLEADDAGIISRIRIVEAEL